MRTLFSIFISLLAFAPAANAQAVADPTTQIQTSAQFAVMMDYESGALLFSKDGDKPMAPASMAKLMTVAIMFEKLKHGELRLEDTFTVSERAWRLSVAGKNESSKMFVSIGSQIKVEDLLRGIIIQSGNDACTVVAEHFSGSEEAFAELMNAHAKKIGLKSSVFKNASGLPHPEMTVTAQDLAKLAAYIIKEYPAYYRYFSEKEFTWNKIRQYNRNLLLGTYPGADGLKTGHTQESGYGLVASAQQEGRRLIVVVNGLTSESERASETKRLLDLGFREFRVYTLFKGGEPVGQVPVWSGEHDQVSLVVKHPVRLLMRRSQRAGLKVVLGYDEPALAPVTKGQELGQLTISAPGVPEVKLPVVAAQDVDTGGIFSQIRIGVEEVFSSKPSPQRISQELSVPENKTASAGGQ